MLSLVVKANLGKNLWVSRMALMDLLPMYAYHYQVYGNVSCGKYNVEQ